MPTLCGTLTVAINVEEGSPWLPGAQFDTRLRVSVRALWRTRHKDSLRCLR
jgi:hypothetical protein